MARKPVAVKLADSEYRRMRDQVLGEAREMWGERLVSRAELHLSEAFQFRGLKTLRLLAKKSKQSRSGNIAWRIFCECDRRAARAERSGAHKTGRRSA